MLQGWQYQFQGLGSHQFSLGKIAIYSVGCTMHRATISDGGGSEFLLMRGMGTPPPQCSPAIGNLEGSDVFDLVDIIKGMRS